MLPRPPRSTLFPYNDALPISSESNSDLPEQTALFTPDGVRVLSVDGAGTARSWDPRTGQMTAQLPTRLTSRSEEHTSELQSQSNLVCRLLLEKKNSATLDSEP